MAMTRDGKMAVEAGSLDKTMRVWDMVRGGASRILREGHTSAIQSVAFAGNGELAVTGFQVMEPFAYGIAGPGGSCGTFRCNRRE